MSHYWLIPIKMLLFMYYFQKYPARAVTIVFVVACFCSIGFSLIPLPGALDCYKCMLMFLNMPTFFIVAIPCLWSSIFVVCWKSEKSQTALNQDDNNVKGKIKKAITTFLLLYLTYFVFTPRNAISIIVAINLGL